MVTTAVAAPPRRYDQTGITSLRGWARLFARQLSPRLVLTALALAAAARLALGGYRWADAVVAAGLVAGQPFTEWMIHVFILHFRPRVVAGRRVDLYIARKHRAHHVDPQDIGLTFVQTPALLFLIISFAVVVGAGFRDPRLALTAMCAGYALLLVYEWTHYLIHTPYAPRHALYRRVWRAHRLHHFKNEHFWFGITSHIADRVLLTFPDKSRVETSPTARRLHGEAVAS